MTLFESPTRRAVMRAAAGLATVIAAPAFARVEQGADVQAGQIARGLVQARDAQGPRPLPGVMVTNGRDVALSDAHGAYEIGLRDGDVLSIVKPAGYALPVDPHTQLPRFHYIHQPEGTPAALQMAFPGVAPTGPLPASVDFTLTPADESRAFDVLLFADPQPETDAEVDYIRDGVLPALIGARVAFGITLGDIVGDDLSLYPRVNRLIGQIGVPWRNVCGNHDLNYEAPDNSRARETFKGAFGPSTYAFAHGEAMFIVLDNVAYEGADPSQPMQMGNYHDRIDDAQLEFVANVLKHTPRDKLIVLCMHIPLRSRRDAGGREIAVDDADALLKILGDRPAISFAGHTHMAEHRYLARADGGGPDHHHHVLAALCGSWWSGPFDRRGVAIADACDGAPSGHYVLHVDGATATTEFHPTLASDDRQVRIALCEMPGGEYRGKTIPKLRAAAIRPDECARTELIVNVFDGGPKTRVSFRIDKGPALPMERQSRPDPFVAQVYARNRATIKPWVNAENSSHVWAAAMPLDIVEGAHVMDVEAIDEFGRPHRRALAFEILSPRRAAVLHG